MSVSPACSSNIQTRSSNLSHPHMSSRDAVPAAARGRDWLSLPEGVLQHIIGLGSTWQIPGSCAAAPVCSTWRAAAAGCSGIRLLYNAGCRDVDESFAFWLESKAGQLGSLILSSSRDASTEQVLHALASAGETAAAAGRPLQLHTLRVLGCGPPMALVGLLVANLPHLVTLQLSDPHMACFRPTSTKDPHQMQSDLEPLKQATQLQELYLPITYSDGSCSTAMARLLPPSLRRFSWEASFCVDPLPDLSHLTRLTFLQLEGCRGGALSSKHLPPHLQQLDIPYLMNPQEVPEKQLQRITGLGSCCFNTQNLSRMPKLRAISVDVDRLRGDAFTTATDGLTGLSALTVNTIGVHQGATPWALKGVLSTAASIQGLRQLSIRLGPGMPPMPGLSRLSGLTRLAVSLGTDGGSVQQHQAWAAELARMPRLRWLSVPHVLLGLPGNPWLSHLTQLKVLQVPVRDLVLGVYVAPGEGAREACEEKVQQILDGGSLRAAPPQLQLLLVTGMCTEQAASLQVRRRLQQQLVRCRGCEVVVVACDPTQQLAGLPEALQQALA